MPNSREPGDKPAQKNKTAKKKTKPAAESKAPKVETKEAPERQAKGTLPGLPESKSAAKPKPKSSSSPRQKDTPRPAAAKPAAEAQRIDVNVQKFAALEPDPVKAKPEPQPDTEGPQKSSESTESVKTVELKPADTSPADVGPVASKPAKAPPQPQSQQQSKTEQAKPAQTESAGSPKPAEPKGRDWSDTLYLPKTEFPMKAGLPDLEPRLLQRWQDIDLYGQLRAQGAGRPKFVLHDGPPYANGNIHIGHALNKILKDLVAKSQTMLGHDSNYVPGWDCHGLPIEWKVEESYREKGQEKPNFSDPVAINAFRGECREFAAKWIGVQREEFKRLGVVGDWDHPYTTMSFPAEAAIARELMKFAMNGSLYRGSKPVMWSVVEQTALAEAEVEYQDYQSDTIWVKFKVIQDADWGDHQQMRRADQACLKPELIDASVVIWTTTPWTMPGNRAVSFSSRIGYGLYEVTKAPEGNWAKTGDRFILADKLAADVMKAAKVEAYERRETVTGEELSGVLCAHPLRGKGYDFDVPLLDGDHVTDDTGTGFVHTAPGHGTDDYNIWTHCQKQLRDRGIDTAIPFTVGPDGVMTKEAPGFEGKRVLKENGDKGDANDAVIKALAEAGAMIARGRLKHQYPHSWRSKKPVIFRNTPQWFVAMDKPLTGAGGNATLRELALSAIERTEWVPASGQNRINGMVSGRPDWVLSRQRAWGVPITVFVHKDTGEVIPNGSKLREDMAPKLAARITDAFAEHGADVWFEAGAKERFLTGLVKDPAEWDQATDILDVWFDSGSTHAFTLEDPEAFPGLSGVKRKVDGGADTVMYLEGSDQHRGWFQSSLLESCGTRGRAPFDVVLTHGFVLDEKGQKMSKSLGNVVAPQDVMSKSGADILRLWVAASDYSDDLRIGPDILKNFVETYRKLRNTLRWMLGALGHYREDVDRVTVELMKARGFELELLMLHRLAELSEEIPKLYAEYNYRTVLGRLTHFMNTELSAFYFDIRKDALYCDGPSSTRRLAALTVINQIFRCSCVWLAPILSFTAEEAWLARYPSDKGSVHLETFPGEEWAKEWGRRDDALAAKWEGVRNVRRVVTGALEIERAAKRIGSSLEAAPRVYISDEALKPVLAGVDMAEICITSGLELIDGNQGDGVFTLPDVKGVAVMPVRAEGRKCARSWRITTDVGSDPDYPELSARDAAAVRELAKQGRA